MGKRSQNWNWEWIAFVVSAVSFLVFSAIAFTADWWVGLPQINYMTSSDRINFISNIRTIAIQCIFGVFLFIGLFWTHRRVKAAEENAHAARDQQNADLFVSAVEFLCSENEVKKLGGIYALERAARTARSMVEYWSIWEYLCSWVRKEYPKKEDLKKEDPKKGTTPGLKSKQPAQVALWAIGRRDRKRIEEEDEQLDLRNANLSWKGFQCRNLHLRSMYFVGADLRGVDFQGANLVRVDFEDTKLEGAIFKNANLYLANLVDADKNILENLREAETLYKAKLSEELQTEIQKGDYAYLLKEPAWLSNDQLEFSLFEDKDRPKRRQTEHQIGDTTTKN